MAAGSAAFDCLIEPRLRLELAAPVAGILQEVLVDRGGYVRKGDVLARLDSAVEEATVALDKARAASEAAIASRSARVAFLTRRRDRFSQLQSRVPFRRRARRSGSGSRYHQGRFGRARDQRRRGRWNERSVASLNQRSVKPVDGVVVEHKLAAQAYA
jgi:multidrug efflux pump subunit AcrA (membrane-fusion protein)